MNLTQWVKYMNRLEEIRKIPMFELRQERMRNLKNDLEIAFGLPEQGNGRARRFYSGIVKEVM